MEYIVLGLLILKSMTIYELNQAFSAGLSMIYAASYGNLQYAVKKLLKNDMISFDEKVENGRNKKIYDIKQSGIEEFFKWMMDDINPKHIETQMLGKLYFLGLVEKKQDKEIIIDNMLKAADEYSKDLFATKEYTDNIDIPEEYREIGKYQLKTLDYGIMNYEVTVKWLKEIKEQL